MRPEDLYKVVDSLAPFSLSEEYCARFSHHDNSGLLIDFCDKIGGVLVLLDLSEKAVDYARAQGVNCIVTHHPVIFYPVSKFSAAENAGLLACMRAGISVISAHLNLDVARGGIDDCLMQGLGGERAEKEMDVLSLGSYGKLFETEKKSMEEFLQAAGNTFCTRRIVSYGSKPVQRIASFCGAGLDERALRFAAENGADTIVSSEGKHHLILAAREKGLNLVFLTHYASEFYGMKQFYQKLKGQAALSGSPVLLYREEDLL